MTAAAVQIPQSTPPVTARQRPAPAALRAFAALLVLPLVFPLALLIWSAVAGGPWAGVLPAGRLAELAFNTLILVVAVVAGSSAVGLGTAWLTCRTNISARRIWSTLAALPLVIPSYVGALALLGATGRQGVVTELVAPLGLGPIPIPRGFWGATLALILFTYPYVHLTLVPAFQSLDPSLDEVARGLGARRGRRFRTVTLPQIGPALRNASLLVALYTMADFGAVSLLRYDTFTRAIFLQYAGRLDRRPATVLAAFLMLMALTVLWAERKSRRRSESLGGRMVRPDALVALSRPARIGAGLFLGTVCLFSIVLPVAILVRWWIRGTLAGRGTVAVWGELGASLGVSALAAALIVLVAVPLAILTVRYRSRSGQVAETVAWTVYALPHITVGLAVLLTGVSVLLPVYQTLPLLLLAYLMMFLPQALGPAQVALRKVSPNLEEASRSLGRPPFATAVKVTIPLIAKGLMAGGALVFLTTMKELPATLLLRPTEFETLAVRIWSATSEGLYTRASFAALVLIAVSAVPLHLFITRDLHD
jgi:iron(III) transport system permease protein